eukprot:g3765.t1
MPIQRRPGNRIADESRPGILNKKIHSFIGIPEAYSQFVQGITSSPGTDGIGITFGEDPPEDDELLEYLTVCVSVHDNHASVYLVLSEDMFKVETGMCWSTFEMLKPADACKIHLAFHQNKALDSYDIYYERKSIPASTRELFVVSKIESVHLSFVLAAVVVACPRSYVAFEDDCLEYARVYLQVFHSIAGIPLDTEAIGVLNQLTVTELPSERSMRETGAEHWLSLVVAQCMSMRPGHLLVGAFLVVPVYILVRLLYLAEQRMWGMLAPPS